MRMSQVGTRSTMLAWRSLFPSDATINENEVNGFRYGTKSWLQHRQYGSYVSGICPRYPLISSRLDIIMMTMKHQWRNNMISHGLAVKTDSRYQAHLWDRGLSQSYFCTQVDKETESWLPFHRITNASSRSIWIEPTHLELVCLSVEGRIGRTAKRVLVINFRGLFWMIVRR